MTISRPIDVEALRERLESVPGLTFATLFGSAARTLLLKERSDIDIGVFLDHVPDVDEYAWLMGMIQDTVGTDRVDLVILNLSQNAILRREALKGRLLVCHDPEAYATFFSLADRQGWDEELRISRAWAIRREVKGG